MDSPFDQTLSLGELARLDERALQLSKRQNVSLRERAELAAILQLRFAGMITGEEVWHILLKFYGPRTNTFVNPFDMALRDARVVWGHLVELAAGRSLAPDVDVVPPGTVPRWAIDALRAVGGLLYDGDLSEEHLTRHVPFEMNYVLVRKWLTENFDSPYAVGATLEGFPASGMSWAGEHGAIPAFEALLTTLEYAIGAYCHASDQDERLARSRHLDLWWMLFKGLVYGLTLPSKPPTTILKHLTEAPALVDRTTMVLRFGESVRQEIPSVFMTGQSQNSDTLERMSVEELLGHLQEALLLQRSFNAVMDTFREE